MSESTPEKEEVTHVEKTEVETTKTSEPVPDTGEGEGSSHAGE